MIAGVYEIAHTPTKKSYIGSSMKCEARFKDHLNQLSKNKHHNKKLQEMYNSEDSKSFKFSILEEFHGDDPKELIELERKWIRKINPYFKGFNEIDAGAGRPLAPHGPTKLMRIPIACEKQVKKIVNDYKKECLGK